MSKKNKLHDYFLNYHRKTYVGNEIGPGEVKPGEVYTIIRKVDKDKVPHFEHKYPYQWGIFVTDKQNRVRMTYNMQSPDTWHINSAEDSYAIPASYHIFPAEWEDRCFARSEWENICLKGRYNSLQQSFDENKSKLNRLQSNPLIRFISRFIK